MSDIRSHTDPEDWSSRAGSAGSPPDPIAVLVELASGRSYEVLVGPGVRHSLASFVGSGVRKVAVVTQREIPWQVDPGVEHRFFEIGAGERNKSMGTVSGLCSEFSRWGLTRADLVVGLGGGMVTDVAGFAASVYHRGLPVVHVPTTLLAQIDAAVGGKTGVNLPEGKNLVGTYWQPEAVLCDTEVLDTLPEEEWRSGLGEMAKYNWLGGGRLDELDLAERIAECVRIKAGFVSADEREAGRRALLNYGHTLAHALETAGGHELRHGEAVAIGLVFAAELAASLGRIDTDAVAEHRRVVCGYGLPSSLPPDLDPAGILELMCRDKKALGDGLTFVLAGPRGVEVVPDVDPEVVRQTLEALT